MFEILLDFPASKMVSVRLVSSFTYPSSSQDVGFLLAMQRGLQVEDVGLSSSRRVQAHQSQAIRHRQQYHDYVRLLF